AISSRNNQGIIGCAHRDDARAAVWDFNTDRMVRTFDQSGAGDAVIYNSKVDQFFFAASSYAPPELSIFAAGPNVNYLTSVRTSHKSHTVAYDESHNLIYTYNGQHGQAELWAFPNPAV